MRSIRVPPHRWLGAASLIAVLAIVGSLVPRSDVAALPGRSDGSR